MSRVSQLRMDLPCPAIRPWLVVCSTQTKVAGVLTTSPRLPDSRWWQEHRAWVEARSCPRETRSARGGSRPAGGMPEPEDRKQAQLAAPSRGRPGSARHQALRQGRLGRDSRTGPRLPGSTGAPPEAPPTSGTPRFSQARAPSSGSRPRRPALLGPRCLGRSAKRSGAQRQPQPGRSSCRPARCQVRQSGWRQTGRSSAAPSCVSRFGGLALGLETQRRRRPATASLPPSPTLPARAPL